MAEKINFKNVNLKDSPFYKAPEDNIYYQIETVVERVEAGLVGTLYITNEINKPFFKKGDLAHIRTGGRIQIGDFILYKDHEEYFLRRIIKYKDEDIYVAGDNENRYHTVQKDAVVGKVIARDRNNAHYSLSLGKKTFYDFKKTKLVKARLGNRITHYEQELLEESLLKAQQMAEEEIHETLTEVTRLNETYNLQGIDLDSDLAMFLDPEDLIKELRQAQQQESLYQQAMEGLEEPENDEPIEQEVIIEIPTEVEVEEDNQTNLEELGVDIEDEE
jgi:hypothetical protein